MYNEIIRRRKYILFSSLCLLIILAICLLVKNITSKPGILHFDELTVRQYNLHIGEPISRQEYLEHKMRPTITTTTEMTEFGEMQVVHIGEIGTLGATLEVNYLNSDYTVDTVKRSEYENKKSIDITGFANIASSREEQAGTISDNTSDDELASSTTDDDSEISESENIVTETPEPLPIISEVSRKEYVSAANSSQAMSYIIYAPENTTTETPIFLFMHGVNLNGGTFDKYMDTFSFIGHLIYGDWKPDVIVVCPIVPKGSSWANQVSNTKTLLGEVINNYGGNWNNIYAAGFSGGSDGLTPLAKEVRLQGGIYIAGYLGAVGNTTDANSFLSMWAGRTVYYFRDCLYGSGGYGYQPDYVATCKNYCSAYGTNFINVDMLWEHKSSMCDAVLLPPYFKDSKGEYCQGALESLIFEH